MKKPKLKVFTKAQDLIDFLEKVTSGEIPEELTSDDKKDCGSPLCPGCSARRHKGDPELVGTGVEQTMALLTHDQLAKFSALLWGTITVQDGDIETAFKAVAFMRKQNEKFALATQPHSTGEGAKH